MKSICTRVGASICCVLVAALVAAFVVTAPTLSAQSPGPWKPLFNGKDLNGFTVAAGRGSANLPPDAPAGWKVENGVLIGGQPAPGTRTGSLLTNEQFKDFELELDFMLAEHGDGCTPDLVGEKQVNASKDRSCAYNSGITMRTAYQVNIGRREAGEFIGVVVHRVSPKAIRGNVLWLDTGDCGSLRDYPITGGCEKFPSIRKKQDWNHMRISFKGPHLQVWLNGKQICNVMDDPTDPAEAKWKEAAPISIQWPPAGESGGFEGFIKYRNMRIRTL